MSHLTKYALIWLSRIFSNTDKYDSALYVLLVNNFDHFANVVQKCMEDCISARSFRDPGSMVFSGRETGGVQIFGSLSAVLLQSVSISPWVLVQSTDFRFRILTRIKNATAKLPKLRPLVLDLHKWMQTWIEGINSGPPTFKDVITKQAPQARLQLTDHITSKIDQLVSIVDREHFKIDRSQRPARIPKPRLNVDGILAALHTTYEGPGYLRDEGPRHDNDFVDINDIRIAPTHEELVCKTPPFLPANRYGAPHPHEQGSVELLEDVQFRLLREELTYVALTFSSFTV